MPLAVATLFPPITSLPLYHPSPEGTSPLLLCFPPLEAGCSIFKLRADLLLPGAISGQPEALFFLPCRSSVCPCFPSVMQWGWNWVGGSGHLRVLGCGVLSSFIITTFTLPFGHSLSSSYAKSVIFVHFLFTFLNQWAPTFLAPGTSFVEDNLPQTGSGDGFWDDSSALHLLCTLFLLLLLHQLHLRSSDIRSWRLGTPVLDCLWKKYLELGT